VRRKCTDFDPVIEDQIRLDPGISQVEVAAKLWQCVTIV
jgi:hypothetical protein